MILLVDFFGDLYRPDPALADDLDRFLICGTVVVAALPLIERASHNPNVEVQIWSEALSPRPGGIELMAEWLRQQVAALPQRFYMDLSFPREQPAADTWRFSELMAEVTGARP